MVGTIIFILLYLIIIAVIPLLEWLGAARFETLQMLGLSWGLMFQTLLIMIALHVLFCYMPRRKKSDSVGKED